MLAIPPKRCDRPVVTYLTDTEVDALLAAPDQRTWTGRRDHALLALAIQTGLRVGELTALTRADVHLGRQPTSAAAVRAASIASPRSPAKSEPCEPGSPRTRANRPTRCS